jgi:hypothetical protein
MASRCQSCGNQLLQPPEDIQQSHNDKKNKSIDKEPKEDNQEDKSHNAKFQDALKTINVISGGDEEFSFRREQKLLL